jgi:hypothetical protein
LPRLLVLSYFEPRAIPRLMTAAQGAGLPATTRVYVGSYGAAADVSAQVVAAGYRYAPMFGVKPGWYWERRRLAAKDERILLERSSRSTQLAGPLPPLRQLLRLPPATRTTWGIELGRRFRDELRGAARAGTEVDGWQLDEILAEAVGPLGRQYRDLTRGALRGLVFGRPVLGDRAQQGLVWWAHTAFALASRPLTPELAAFWRILNRAGLGLIGEEYPEYAGDPVAAARREAAGQVGLLRGGPVRRSLARKYLAGLTPGYRLLPGLGGNTHGLPRVEVNRWVERYARARVAAGVAGFAEFNFRFENSSARVMHDTLRALARVL